MNKEKQATLQTGIVERYASIVDNVQNFSEVYNFLEKNNLSSKFGSTEQLVNAVKKSFSAKTNFSNKTIKLKKMGSDILNNTLADINSYL